MVSTNLEIYRSYLSTSPVAPKGAGGYEPLKSQKTNNVNVGRRGVYIYIEGINIEDIYTAIDTAIYIAI